MGSSRLWLRVFRKKSLLKIIRKVWLQSDSTKPLCGVSVKQCDAQLLLTIDPGTSHNPTSKKKERCAPLAAILLLSRFNLASDWVTAAWESAFFRHPKPRGSEVHCAPRSGVAGSQAVPPPPQKYQGTGLTVLSSETADCPSCEISKSLGVWNLKHVISCHIDSATADQLHGFKALDNSDYWTVFNVY